MYNSKKRRDLPAFCIILSSDIIEKMRKINKKPIILSLTAIFLVFYIFSFSLSDFVFVSARSATEEEIKDDMEELEKKLKKAENDYGKLSQQYQQILKFIETAQKEINKTNSLISSAKEEISRKEKEIELLGKRIAVDREIMKKILQQIYFSKKSFFSNLMSGEGKPNRLEGNSEYLANFEDKLGAIMEDIKRSNQEISKEKENLEENKKDHENLLALKEDQKSDLVGQKIETQVDIKKKESTISELQSKLSKLKSELSSLLGKSYNAKDIQDAASFAGKMTGVRKDFLLGMLVVESDLGRFTGGCTATESRMSDYRLGIFKDICEGLDYNWKKQKVSCPPRSYKGTGGAMGVAQFMSDTWMGYKSSIASATGHNPPDPWNLTDGVTAMALKLAKGGATKKSGECNAAKLYLSGSTSSKYNWYCERVSYWADNYENKF